MSSSPGCTSSAVAGDDLLALHVGGLFAILAVSGIGVAIPLAVSARNLTVVFFLLRALAAGVVLATGLVHVLGDAFPLLSDPCLGLSTTYPWAMMFATFSALLTFMMEHHITLWSKSRLERALDAASAAASDVEGATAAKEAELVNLASRVYYRSASLTYEIGIIFHSIFIGITFGLSSSTSTARALMIALMFHQGCEGIALGSTLVKASYTRLTYVTLSIMFVLVTPVGVAIGVGVGGSYQSESRLALGFEGAFDSLSAGMLIYNAIADLMIPTFRADEAPPQRWVQTLGFVALFLGAGVMSVIGIWA